MRLSDSQIAQVAADAGFSGDALVTAVAVALAESGGNAGNTSGDGGTSYGLWQIHWTVHPQYAPQQLTDPNYNASAAFDISNGGTNWYPWTTWKTGAYRKYLSRAQAAVLASAGVSPILSSSGNSADTSSFDDSGDLSPQFFATGIGVPAAIGIAAAVLVLILIVDN
jgi:hypothetical protein